MAWEVSERFLVGRVSEPAVCECIIRPSLLRYGPFPAPPDNSQKMMRRWSAVLAAGIVTHSSRIEHACISFRRLDLSVIVKNKGRLRFSTHSEAGLFHIEDRTLKRCPSVHESFDFSKSLAASSALGLWASMILVKTACRLRKREIQI